jgi:predicted nucleic acid-binding protein
VGVLRPRGHLRPGRGIHKALAEQAQRRSASIPDLIVAATAWAQGVEVLHYDRYLDTIAGYTDQSARWVVPPDTV